MTFRECPLCHLLILVFLVAPSSAPVAAQDKAPNAPPVPADQTFRAGGKSFLLPSPSPDLAEVGPDFRVLMETFAPENNRLLAAYLSPEMLPKLRNGTVKVVDRYALAEVPRRLEFSEVTPDFYKQVADGVSKEFGAQVEASRKDQQDALNRRLKALNSDAATLSLDKPIQLGSVFSKPDACGYGMIMPVSSEGETTRMLMGMIVVRVQKRLLFGYVYTVYKDEQSVEWMRKTSEGWADSILQSNKE